MIRSRAFVLAGVSIGCFVLLFAYALLQLVTIDRSLRFGVGENMLWAVSQAGREAQRMKLALATGASEEDLRTRSDILHSRVLLLDEGPQRAFFAAMGLVDLADHAIILQRQIDTGLAVVGAVDGPLDQLDLVLRRLANDTVTTERNMRGEQREQQRGAIQILLLSVLGAFASGAFMAALLVRNVRQSDRAQRDLEQHRALLEETVALRTHELQDALAAERRAKEVYRSFIITVPHQFRTPLSVIHMVAQRQLREPSVKDTPLEKKFQRILESAQRLERLLNGIMTVATMDSHELTRSSVDLNTVAGLAVRQLRDAFPAAVVRTELSAEPLMIEGDGVLLEQVVLNLLTNAVKYSPAGMPVTLRTERRNAAVLCTVVDTGMGIPESAQGTIFERFYRAPNVHHLPGMGVGLSLSRDIVTLHDGYIGFVSREGTGSSFTITLPAQEGADETAGDDPLRRG